jgi:hypothetical protein
MNSSLVYMAVAPAACGRLIAVASLALLYMARGASADVVIEWNEIMERTIATADPYHQIRSATITQVAVYEAVNAIVGDYEPYFAQIDAAPDASPEAAAVTAAHGALGALFPEQAKDLDAARDASLAQIPDGPAKQAGIAVGEEAARAIVDLRADDGSFDVVPYEPGKLPGDWRPTPPDFAPAFMPGLGEIDTFVIEDGAQFRAPAPPYLRSAGYAQQYDDVKEKGELNSDSRPPDRADVARFYELTEPVQLWNPAARQVSVAQGTTLSENARIFALLQIGIFDACVAVFESKYHYDLWRPVTAIRAGHTDHNDATAPDPDWTAFVYTPPFPSYPSGHAAFGGAARRILEYAFGPDGHAITLTHPDLPDIVLHYGSFEEITRDVDDGRVYGGVHYRVDQDAGGRQGRRVGMYVLRHALRPLRAD